MTRIRGSAMEGRFTILCFLSSVLCLFTLCNATDTINGTWIFRDGESLISSNGSFEMGFFSPGNSQNRYLGIWYRTILPTMTVVWVANREAPLANASGALRVIRPGVLVIVNATNATIWSTNTSRSVENPVAQLLDSGNLVVRDGDDGDLLWQSFDYPTDTLLPGMRYGLNLVTGREWHQSGWKSIDDPAPGEYTHRVDPTGYPQNFIYRGAVETYRSGPWNGIRFGIPYLTTNPIYRYGMIINKTDVYYTYEVLNSSIITRFVLNYMGVLQRWIWIDQSRGWELYLSAPKDICDDYGKCGAHGSCNVDNSPSCECLDKFEPRYLSEWNNLDWSNGCVRKTPLDCQKGDGFLRYGHVKLPDTRHSWYNTTMTLRECRQVCLRNCSCMAYANLDIRDGGSGCLLWFGELRDIRQYGADGGQDLYIRMASSEIGNSDGQKRRILIVTLTLMGVLLLGLILAFHFWKRKKRTNSKPKGKGEGGIMHNFVQAFINGSDKDDFELPLFDFTTLANATDNFSFSNKLGEGGFGRVYKGILEDGKEIAVKRLSEESNQGLNEFKNEVICIAKLQHRNLVRLLGCCIEGEEKMLVYEYMPNGSLNSFIFDEARRTLLDWPMLFNIINGIARGLLYLHQDSHLRVIHRDLKVSNILLDMDMNPKISDFGVARSFGENETEANTKRVVGTHGYMAPEYAVDGYFSVKSDVFSFGVMVLEIVSGKRNRGFLHPDHHLNLLGHAWRLFNEGRSTELVESGLQNSSDVSQVLRSIHVGLLCVQQSPRDRPDMSSVVLMLGSDGVLVQPKQPGYFTERIPLDQTDDSSSKHPTGSVNEVTITLVEAR